MAVHKFYTESPLRNYAYLFDLNEKDVVAIDPLFSEQIIDWCKENGKNLSTILITHEHPDHIHALDELRESFQTDVWAHPSMNSHISGITKELCEGDLIQTADGEVEILHTPGHTPTHICLLFKKNGKQTDFIAMDTVFNAGVGHCKLGGNPNILYKTIKRLATELSGDVILHPGHDYIEKNLKFTLDREPDNQKANELLDRVRREGGLNIQTTISEEKEINVFFRLNSDSVIANLSEKNLSEEEVFIKLRKLRDNF